MSSQEIISKINDFLVEEFEVEKGSFGPEDDLRKALDLDSLDYVDLVVVIESNFGFKVKPEDFSGIKTFEDFYNYVIGKLSAN